MLLSDVFQFQIRYKISPKVSPLLGMPRKPPSGPGGFLRSKPPRGSTPRSLCMSGHILSLNSNERESPAVMCKNFCHVHSYIKMEKGMEGRIYYQYQGLWCHYFIWIIPKSTCLNKQGSKFLVPEMSWFLFCIVITIDQWEGVIWLKKNGVYGVQKREHVW